MNLFPRLLLSLAPALLLVASAAASDPAPRLQRATLTVSDLPAALAFYRDLLGLTVSAESDYDSPALRAMFHVPEGSVARLVLLDAGPQQPRALGLLHVPGAEVDPEANRLQAPALVFDTARMDALHAALAGAGTPVVVAPTPLLDFQGRPFGREAMYLDPDGVRVVLFEQAGARP